VFCLLKRFDKNAGVFGGISWSPPFKRQMGGRSETTRHKEIGGEMRKKHSNVAYLDHGPKWIMRGPPQRENKCQKPPQLRATTKPAGRESQKRAKDAKKPRIKQHKHTKRRRTGRDHQRRIDTMKQTRPPIPYRWVLVVVTA